MSDVLVVEDDLALQQWALRVISERGYSCEGARDATSAREQLRHEPQKLALLDINLPGESGLQLLGHVRSEHPDTAVLMVTVEDSHNLALTAIEQGAYGYLVKPVSAGELLINVVSALHRRRVELGNRQMLTQLRETVAERSERLQTALRELREAESAIAVSDSEAIDRLTRVVQMRDGETGRHLQRMSCMCEILAKRYGLPTQQAEMICLASRLHDVGKLAVPDAILLKPGKLTEAEMETIRGHAEAGYNMLRGSKSKLLQLGATIAFTHHERFDGTGYPRGLAGHSIPLEGRIAAIADVYDALKSDRVYRSALPTATAVEIMQAGRGSQFDPHLLDIFMEALPEMQEARSAYPD